MKQTLSDVYYDLAIAYNEAVPENNYQKKKYFEETISNLETAIGYNPENADAQRALEQFKTDHFRELLDKGIANYNKGKQDPINYLTADYYLTNARKLDPENADAKKYLRLVRQKNLNILDPGQDVPLAVTDQKRDENIQAYHIILHNQSGESIPVSPENFYLITNSGKEIQGSWSEKYQPVFPTKVLATNQEVEGVVTFDAGNARDFSRLEFRHGENVPGYKNLP
jgi:tetratricopeptide (TPR) repeat protein